MAFKVTLCDGSLVVDFSYLERFSFFASLKNGNWRESRTMVCKFEYFTLKNFKQFYQFYKNNIPYDFDFLPIETRETYDWKSETICEDECIEILRMTDFFVMSNEDQSFVNMIRLKNKSYLNNDTSDVICNNINDYLPSAIGKYSIKTPIIVDIQKHVGFERYVVDGNSYIIGYRNVDYINFLNREVKINVEIPKIPKISKLSKYMLSLGPRQKIYTRKIKLQSVKRILEKLSPLRKIMKVENGQFRAGKKLLLFSPNFANQFRRSTVIVNPCFRFNYFPISENLRNEGVTKHRDAQFITNDLISSFVMLIYLTTVENPNGVLTFYASDNTKPHVTIEEEKLRVFKNFKRIEAGTIIIFHNSLIHEGRPSINSEKIFLKTDIIQTKADNHKIKFDECFNSACVMDIFNIDEKHTRELFERALSARVFGFDVSYSPKEYYQKDNFYTNGTIFITKMETNCNVRNFIIAATVKIINSIFGKVFKDTYDDILQFGQSAIKTEKLRIDVPFFTMLWSGYFAPEDDGEITSVFDPEKDCSNMSGYFPREEYDVFNGDFPICDEILEEVFLSRQRSPLTEFGYDNFNYTIDPNFSESVIYLMMPKKISQFNYASYTTEFAVKFGSKVSYIWPFEIVTSEKLSNIKLIDEQCQYLIINAKIFNRSN